jgi:flagellar hook-basal body complex protein FliE
MIPLSASLVTQVGSLASDGVNTVTQALSSGAASRTSQSGEASQASFSDVLGQLVSDSVDTIKGGEAASIAGISGKASAQQVVDQVMSAQRTLQTAIALRDKAVGAYQEISKMTI